MASSDSDIKIIGFCLKKYEKELPQGLASTIPVLGSEHGLILVTPHRLRRMAECGVKRGAPPTLAEIEQAKDSVFNPSYFGTSLQAWI
jgi:hypothetical protein